MDDSERIAVSPRHTVRLAADYVAFVRRAPGRDFVVQTLAKREVHGNVLMTADVVIAGADTREKFPLAATYPLHFRKTYFPGQMHGDPQDEFTRHTRAAELLGIAAPIGWTPASYRSCLVPGKPLSRLTPFGSDPEESNLRIARDLPLHAAAGLWHLTEQAYLRLRTLHGGGLAHGDAELHNFVVAASPLEVVPIDFEGGLLQDSLSPAAWEKRQQLDTAALLKEAIYLMCALGPQEGPFAEAALERVGQLFKRPDSFKREIERRLEL